MARKFLTHINLAKNEIQNAIIQNLAAAPSAPKPGQIYYNTVKKTFEYYGEADWVDPTARAKHTGTQSVETITGLADIATSGDAADLTEGTLPAARFSDTAHGARSGGSTHAKAVAGGASGFMTGADKAKLDTIAANATVNETDSFLRDRANHTGKQLASTITDFVAQVRSSSIAQMAAPKASVDIGKQRLTNVASPTLDADAATKSYVDALVSGIDWKVAVRAATTVAVELSGDQTVDGIPLVAGDRVLVKNQAVSSTNGIYVVAAGAWSRSPDASASVDVTSGMAMMVTEGTVLGDTRWDMGTKDTIIVGTTPLVFIQVGAVIRYTGANGVTVTGNTISVNVDSAAFMAAIIYG